MHKENTKYMTNHADSEDILTDQEKNEKVTEFKYLRQTTHLKDTTKEEIYARIRATWSCFGKNMVILQGRQLPISLKKTSNGPVHFADNDLWLPNMVS